MDRSREADRALGRKWERAFVEMCAEHGRRASLHHAAYRERVGSDYEPSAAFDVSVMHGKGDERHEVKHKSATRQGKLIWEKYRLEKLLDVARASSTRTFFTIHRWDKAPGGRDGVENRIDDWYTVEAKHLAMLVIEGFVDHMTVPTYYNRGNELVYMPAYAWRERYWMPLRELWAGTANPSFLPDWDEWVAKLAKYRPESEKFAREMRLPGLPSDGSTGPQKTMTLDAWLKCSAAGAAEVRRSLESRRRPPPPDPE